jgi:hypothetical protein
MFSSSGITVAPKLPATTLQNSCYNGMFGNTQITAMPELPATTLARDCYTSMFAGCKNLITVTELPATTTVEGCYNNMFNSCSALTVSPDIKATSLANTACSNMFVNCTSLAKITCRATSFGTNACWNWTNNVAANGTFYKASRVSWASGADGIPTGWTIQNI